MPIAQNSDRLPADAPPEVVVLGHTGAIGGRLVRYLAEQGVRTLGVSRAECDLLDRERTAAFLERLPCPCALVFASVINRWQDDSFPALQKNLAMAENLARAVPRGLHSLVYLSTVDVYGRRPALPLREDSAIRPDSYYALAKFGCERLLETALDRGLAPTILRLPGIYGSGPGERSVLGGFLGRILRGEPIRIFGDGSVERDFVFVDDLCEIIRRLVASPPAAVLNVATGSSLAMLEVVSTLGRVLGRAPEIEFGPYNDQAAASLRFDPGALRAALPGLRLRSLEEGCRIFLQRIPGTESATLPLPKGGGS
jgi:UDP-glucose 4-epimerase